MTCQRFARHLFAVLLSLGLMLTGSAARAEWTPQPPCFPNAPAYQYADDHLAISIARYEEPGLLYFIADVQISSPEYLLCGLSGDRRNGVNEKTSDIAQRNGAMLAINGDDYRTHGSGIIIRNGEIFRAKASTRHILTIDQHGDFGVTHHGREDGAYNLAQEMVVGGVVNALEFGPILVENGQASVLNESFDLVPVSPKRLEPRTAIGQLGPLHYVVIVAEGRTRVSKGMAVTMLQRLFLDLGVHTAFNLDGGGSTTLYFNGEVLNRTASGKERQVSDILMFR